MEKPQDAISNLALVGLYYIADSDTLRKGLNELIKKDIRTKGELQLTDALQIMINTGEKFTTFPVDGWYDCGKPETLLSTNKFLLGQKSVTKNLKTLLLMILYLLQMMHEIKNSVIGPYATIDKGCKIEDCIIKNSIVGANSIL